MGKCWLGVDGCRTGWVVSLCQNDGLVDLFHINSLKEIESVSLHYSEVTVVAIDIPFGLADKAERGGRGCDREARRILSISKRNAVKIDKATGTNPLVGPSSIFTPPTRPALDTFSAGATHAEVSRANIVSRDEKTTAAEGLGLSIQSYHIMPKIKEADDLLRPCHHKAAMAFAAKIPFFECHPELAFLAATLSIDTEEAILKDLNATKALVSKKHIRGRRQRLQLLRHRCNLDLKHLCKLTRQDSNADDLEKVNHLELLCAKQIWKVQSFPSRGVQDANWISVAADDAIDAIICAHSAYKWQKNKVIRIYEENSQCIDGRGLPMLIQI